MIKEVKIHVWQVGAYGYTMEKVAKEFAETYFGEPRKIKKLEGNKFSLLGGIADYEIELKDGNRYIPSYYSILRIDKVTTND